MSERDSGDEKGSGCDEGEDGGWAVVSACRALKNGQVWVQWLGYGEERSCWREEAEHFALPAGAAELMLPGIDAPKLMVSTILLDESPSTTGDAIGGTAALSQGASVQAAGIAATAGPTGEGGAAGSSRDHGASVAVGDAAGALAVEVLVGRAPSGGSGPSLQKKRRRSGKGGRRGGKKKGPRKEYTTKVHTIRVGRDGVVEICGVRTTGGKGAKRAKTEVMAGDGGAAGPAGEGGMGGVNGAGGSGDSTAGAPPPLYSGGPPSLYSGAEGSGSSGSQGGGGGVSNDSIDELSAVWQQHRRLNQQVRAIYMYIYIYVYIYI